MHDQNGGRLIPECELELIPGWERKANDRFLWKMVKVTGRSRSKLRAVYLKITASLSLFYAEN
jgi:hypothetical protein